MQIIRLSLLDHQKHLNFKFEIEKSAENVARWKMATSFSSKKKIIISQVKCVQNIINGKWTRWCRQIFVKVMLHDRWTRAHDNIFSNRLSLVQIFGIQCCSSFFTNICCVRHIALALLFKPSDKQDKQI